MSLVLWTLLRTTRRPRLLVAVVANRAGMEGNRGAGRGGRPVGDAAANAEAGGKPRGERKPEAASAPPSAEKPSLLGRIKAGLKSLVKRNPPSGH